MEKGGGGGGGRGRGRPARHACAALPHPQILPRPPLPLADPYGYAIFALPHPQILPRPPLPLADPYGYAIFALPHPQILPRPPLPLADPYGYAIFALPHPQILPRPPLPRHAPVADRHLKYAQIAAARKTAMRPDGGAAAALGDDNGAVRPDVSKSYRLPAAVPEPLRPGAHLPPTMALASSRASAAIEPPRPGRPLRGGPWIAQAGGPIAPAPAEPPCSVAASAASDGESAVNTGEQPSGGAPADPAAKPPPPKPAAAAKPPPPKPAAAAKPPPPKPAAAAKPPPPPPPEFETRMTDRITERFGDKAEIVAVRANRIAVRTTPSHVRDVAAFIRDELNFDHAESVSGVDYPKDSEIEVVYHLGSYLDPSLAKQVMALHVRAPREDDPDPGGDSTRLPSLRDVFYSVEFHERECFEMLGVYFEGHPDNRRLLLPEDWADLPPLRKDFAIKGR